MMNRSNGTTSSGVIGVPSYTERTYEAKLRRQQLHAIENPPEDATAKFYREAYERDQARLKRWADEDRAKQEKIRAENRAMQEATQREIERLRRVKDFKLKEHLIEGVFAESGLTPAERARVTERLLAMGDVHNTDAATIFAQEEVLSRGARKPDESNGMDWRGVITATKK
ncbi:MAG: hypothetical protein WBW57_10435 [Candidatus Sulfotelmatobacter sp.]